MNAHSPYIRFKTSRIENEWLAWQELLHPALYVLVLSAALWLYRKTGKRTVITDLLRTEAEERAIYPNEPDKRSVHQYGRGADLKTNGVPPDVIKEWVDWINEAWRYYGSSGLLTALYHEVGGGGLHLHIQIGPLELKPEQPKNYIMEA
ncbi:MAG: hypothetical protein AAB538_05905 [Patescibacteria group bacterium]